MPSSPISAAKNLNRFRWIGLAEGTSFLLLLGIAMPLKYVFDMPLAVKYTGWAHGVLFIAYLVSVILCVFYFRKPILFGLSAVVASLVPFGPFILDRFYKNWLKAEYQESPSPSQVES
jgi:integral membrane protein